MYTFDFNRFDAFVAQHDYSDWWWKARLGKAYYQLGMLRDAEKQFRSAMRMLGTIPVYLELGKVFLKLDQPNAALEHYNTGAESFPGDPNMLLGAARVHDMLGDTATSGDIYKKVVKLDASNVEAIANLAANHFYTDQPEVALKYYRRLLQVSLPEKDFHLIIGSHRYHGKYRWVQTLLKCGRTWGFAVSMPRNMI